MTDPVYILIGLVVIALGALALSYVWNAFQRNTDRIRREEAEKAEMLMRLRSLEDNRRPSYNDVATYEDAMAVIIDTQKKMEQFNLRLEQARRILGNGRNGQHDHNAQAGERPDGWEK